MLRSGVIAQYYRRGKSVGRRDFSSSGGNKSDVGLAGSVMGNLFPYGVGLALGTGSTAVFSFIFGCRKSGKVEEIEQRWKMRQLELDQLDRTLEEHRKFNEKMRRRIAAFKGA